MLGISAAHYAFGGLEIIMERLFPSLFKIPRRSFPGFCSIVGTPKLLTLPMGTLPPPFLHHHGCRRGLGESSTIWRWRISGCFCSYCRRPDCVRRSEALYSVYAADKTWHRRLSDLTCLGTHSVYIEINYYLDVNHSNWHGSIQTASLGESVIYIVRTCRISKSHHIRDENNRAHTSHSGQNRRSRVSLRLCFSDAWYNGSHEKGI